MFDPGHEVEYPPMSAAERRNYLLGWCLFLAGMTAFVCIDYEPGKLAWLFFVLFWIVQLPVHEAGHALMTQLLGWRVEEVVIGMGRTVARFQVGQTPVEIRFAPTMGFVRPGPNSLDNFRVKNALVYFAGPGIELLVLAGLLVVVGPQRLFDESTDVPMIAAKMLAAVIVVSTFFNLWPHEAQVNGRFVPNDGLGILWSWQKPMSFFVQGHEDSVGPDADR